MTPPPPNRAHTDLLKRLSLPETRTTAVASVVAAFRATGSLDGAAGMLGVSSRTLKRLLVQYPDLDRLIDEVRRAGR